MQTFSDLIKEFGGATRFSEAIDVPVPTAQSMSMRSRIDPGYWPAIIAAAEAKGIEGVDLALLASMAAQMPPRPARRTGPRRAEKTKA